MEVLGMHVAYAALVAFLTAVWIAFVTIGAARRLQLGVDAASGIHKLHSHWVPRLGGVPIFVGYVSALLILAWLTDALVNETTALIVCLLPAFGIGLLEDLTSKAGIAVRLALTMVAAALGWWLLGAHLNRLDIPGIDALLGSSVVAAFCLTVFAAAGVSHAANIIDGCNGLSSFVCALVLACIGLVAYRVGDVFVMQASWLAAAAVLGFFVWNFPFGRIFLGDAGAYMVGFTIAEMSILLVVRNPEVSAWFPMLLMVYPVWETLFSMYRRAKTGMSRISQPDSLHLHHLVYRRLVRDFGSEPAQKVLRNSASSVYVWMPVMACAVFAVTFYEDTAALMLGCLAFIGAYLFFYRAIVVFRTPRMLVLRRRPALADEEALIP